VAGSCEHNDKPSGYIKCGEFPDQLSVLLASQGLCSMELVSYYYYCCYLSYRRHHYFGDQVVNERIILKRILNRI
jgi:hypothetical protein